jgi:hypothetical protein
MNARTSTGLRCLTADELHQVSGGSDEAAVRHEAMHKAENSKTPSPSVPITFGSMLWRVTIRF